MINAGLPETIVLSIQQSKANFDLSLDSLIKLKREGAARTAVREFVTTGP